MIIIIIIITIIITIIIRYGCLLSQAFSLRYFSWTSSDPHRSRFKLHTAVLSELCVTFQVQLSFVVNLSNAFLVQLPNFSLSFSLLFQWLMLLVVQPYISVFNIHCNYIYKLYFNLLLLLLLLLLLFLFT